MAKNNKNYQCTILYLDLVGHLIELGTEGAHVVHVLVPVQLVVVSVVAAGQGGTDQLVTQPHNNKSNIYERKSTT